MTTTLITGGNTGIGYETALALAKDQHELILTSRSLTSATAAAARIKQEVATAVVQPLALDLNDFSNIHAFAQRAIEMFPALDIAIFNAGIMAPPYALSADGYEVQFQANYLGHFYLYLLLREALLAGGGKVINVSSMASERSEASTLADFQRLAQVSEAAYDGMTSYRASKLAQVLFTVELARRDGDHGLRSYAVHPGIVNTELFYRDRSELFKQLMRPFVWLGYQSGFILRPEDGAATSIYLAQNDVEPSGAYWADESQREMNPIARDKALAASLWEWSQEIVPET